MYRRFVPPSSSMLLEKPPRTISADRLRQEVSTRSSADKCEEPALNRMRGAHPFQMLAGTTALIPRCLKRSARPRASPTSRRTSAMDGMFGTADRLSRSNLTGCLIHRLAGLGHGDHPRRINAATHVTKQVSRRRAQLKPTEPKKGKQSITADQWLSFALAIAGLWFFPECLNDPVALGIHWPFERQPATRRGLSC